VPKIMDFPERNYRVIRRISVSLRYTNQEL